ncbi:unnamed protein product [Schistosoma curassoni]|uniref:Inner membrane protein n=1 Tax=Schistosoma curassoni TaxID=6186 RepID=A0A183L155_9TREM|nr:unnamed protein product [Schistosoma curassoni]
MFHSQPWMALAILPLSLYIEGKLLYHWIHYITFLVV